MLDDLSEKYDNFQQEFRKFMNTNASLNKTWQFWAQFVFQDCFAYVTLHLAIRSGKWDLRMAAIKSMAALFTAFDRPNYQKLIPQYANEYAHPSQRNAFSLEKWRVHCEY